MTFLLRQQNGLVEECPYFVTYQNWGIKYSGGKDWTNEPVTTRLSRSLTRGDWYRHGGHYAVVNMDTGVHVINVLSCPGLYVTGALVAVW